MSNKEMIAVFHYDDVSNRCGAEPYRYAEEIVRCKECVRANTFDCSHSYWDDDWGVWRLGYKGDDWFCADGERNSEKPNNSKERSSE